MNPTSSRSKRVRLLIYLPIIMAIFYLCEDTLPRYFGFKPLLSFETESSKSQFLAGSLTQSSYLYAAMAQNAHPALDYRLDQSKELEDALHAMGQGTISLTFMDSAIKSNRGFSARYQLHIRHYAVTGGYRYPIFTNDEIDETVKSDDPQSYLDYLGVSTDGITRPK